MASLSERLSKRLSDSCEIIGHQPLQQVYPQQLFGVRGLSSSATSTLTELLSIFSLVIYGVVADEAISLTLGNLFPHDCDCLHTNVVCLSHRTH